MVDLIQALRIDNQVKAELLARHPDLAADEQALIDTLDGISNLDEAVFATLRIAKEREAYADALNGMILELKRRKARMRNADKRLRDVCLQVMQEAGRKQFSAPDMLVTVKPGEPGLIVTDADAIPARFCNIERTPRLKAIEHALYMGEAMPPGVERRNPRPYIEVRRS